MSHLQLSLSIWRTLVQGSHSAKVWGCSAVHIKWCNVCRWPVFTLPWTLNNLLVLIPKNVSDMSVVTDYCLQTNGKRKVCPWSIQVHSPLDIFDIQSFKSMDVETFNTESWPNSELRSNCQWWFLNHFVKAILRPAFSILNVYSGLNPPSVG